MQTATLVISSLALITSGASLAILLKFAKEAKTLQEEVETVKGKTVRNADKIMSVLKDLEV